MGFWSWLFGGRGTAAGSSRETRMFAEVLPGHGRINEEYGRNRLPRDWWQVEGAVALCADKGPTVEVVGESFYQGNFEDIIGTPYERGVYWDIVAQVLFQDGNPHDPNAVLIVSGGKPLGHIAKRDSLKFRRQILAVNPEQRPVICKGQIIGGWANEGGVKASYGLTLSIEMPMRLRGA